MIDKMVDITHAQLITGGFPSRSVFCDWCRGDKQLRAKKYADTWFMPKSALYKKLKMTGDFNDVVQNRMLCEYEFADLAGLSPATVKNMRKREQLMLDGEPLGCQCGREWRVSYNQAAEWLGLHVNLDIAESEIEPMPVLVLEDAEGVSVT